MGEKWGEIIWTRSASVAKKARNEVIKQKMPQRKASQTYYPKVSPIRTRYPVNHSSVIGYILIISHTIDSRTSTTGSGYEGSDKSVESFNSIIIAHVATVFSQSDKGTIYWMIFKSIQ
jgi:hypothetical protein